MADNLIFPIKFDLEGGVKEALKDGDKYLRQLENTLRQKPIRLDVAIDGAAPGSIDAISKRMAALIQEFNKLTEAQRVYNRTSGEFTPEAQKIIKEYAELTAATQTYAQSLSQITAAAKRQTDEQIKEQEREMKRYEEYWKRKETENAKQAQQDIDNAERAREAQQRRIAQEQAADAKRYQEWLRQKNQEAVETERMERQKQQSVSRTIALQNKEFEAQRQSEQQRQQAISASLRAEYQRIEAKKQAEAASRSELELLNKQYAAEEYRQRLAASQASIAKRQQVIKTLRAEENTIVNITAKLQHWQRVMNSSAMDGRQFRRAAEEVRRLSQTLSEAQSQINILTSSTQSGASRQVEAHKEVTRELNNQSSYLKRLLIRMATYWSVQQVKTLITSIREVTAEFELQRVSLGAIIQDPQRANQLFSEIKAFALKSPISVLDLTKYTKQLAAYKIETKDLFNTTKRLADVSVGLGVSMDRIILAYGQVKAASYLRASEIRQFTEAGIPMLELLAEKFTEIQGKTVSTADVMEMVSKRMVEFSMVKDIFEDMTNAGGLFYNMQEKQGNTLYGMWAKLSDAAAIMYEEIGNTEGVNETIRTMTQALTDLMKNWEQVGSIIGSFGLGVVGSIVIKKVVAPIQDRIKAINRLRSSAAQTYNTASIAYRDALNKERLARKTCTLEEYKAVAAKTDAAKASYELARAEYIASQKTTLLGRAFRGLTNILKANIIGIIITAIAGIINYFRSANDEMKKFNSEMAEIERTMAEKNRQDIAKFKALADSITNSLDGTKIQKKAIDELGRSYGDVIDKQLLTAENLKRLNGDYQEFYDLIEANNLKQKKERKDAAVREFYGEPIKGARAYILDKYKAQKNIVFEALQEFEELIEDGISAFEAKKIVNDKYRSRLGVSIIDPHITLLYHDQTFALKKNRIEYEKNIDTIQPYRHEIEELARELNDLDFSKMDKSALSESTLSDLDINSYAKLRFEQNSKALIAVDKIKDILTKAGVDLTDDLEKSFFKVVDRFDSSTGEITMIYIDRLIDYARSIKDSKLIDALKDLKDNAIDAIVPTKASIAEAQKQFTGIADAVSKGTGIAFDKFKYLMIQNGQDLKTYRETLENEANKIRDTLQELAYVEAREGSFWQFDFFNQEKRKEAEAQLNVIVQMLAKLPFAKNGGSGSSSDSRLQNLQEIEKTLTTINKKYEELVKKEGQTAALDYVKKNYATTLDYINKLGKKFGLTFEMPTDFKDLQDYRKQIQKVIETLKMKGFEKAAIELELTIAEGEQDKLEKQIDKTLKELADRISRTKTAKEFYDKVLGMTGDYELAMHVSTVIYGSTGKELDEQIKEQFRLAFATLDKPDVEVSAKIGDLIDKGRYEELRDYINLLPEDERKAAEDLVKAQQQMSAQQYEQWIKDLDKAKTFADKRIELSRYTANKIAAIEERIAKLNPADKDYAAQKAILENMIKGYNQREEREAAKLEYDAFKDTPLYVQMFEDLEHASTSTLEHMKQKLIALKSVWGTALDPAQLKEMQSRLNEIESQLLARNPWKALKEAYRDYTKTVKEYSVSGAEANVATAQANYNAIVEDKGADSKEALAAAETLKIEQQRLDIVKQLTNEKGKQLTGQKALDKAMQIANDKEGQARVDLATAEAEYQKAIKDSGSPESEDAKAAHTFVEEKKEALNLAQETSNIIQQDAKTSKTLKESMAAAAQGVVAGLHAAGDIAAGIAKVTETLGGDELDVQYWNDIADGLNEIGDGIGNVVQAAISGNPMAIVSSVINLIPSMISGFSKVFNAGKIRKANKEIRWQQELLEQLEYTYGRLEKSAEQALGTDYIENYNQRIKNLQAQAAAYQAQAAAERSKGKDADKDKIEEYEKSARDTMDEIADMQNELVEKIMGTDVASAARDFATAWLEAKASFANTADAIKGKYKELVKNMIIETMASKVMQSILQPLFDNIDALLKKGDIDGAVDYLITGMDEFIETADNGMNVLYNKLLARGYDMQSILGDTEDLTGISRNIATASEESINGLAAGINTQNYYISYVPTISENVAAIRQLMERGTTATIPEAAASGWTDWQQQAMDNYLAIQRNTADTVVECRRAANACEEAVAKMNRIIKVKGATQGINVFLNS